VSNSESDTEKLLDVAADLVLCLDAVFDAFRRYSRRAVQLRVKVTLEGVEVMDFPDSGTLDAVLTFSDRFGDKVPEPAPVTWAVSDAALAEITPDPADDTKATVKALAGAGTFTISATSGSLIGSSEALNITPGAAVGAAISVVLEPPA
jgi:hypothetical protein